MRAFAGFAAGAALFGAAFAWSRRETAFDGDAQVAVIRTSGTPEHAVRPDAAADLAGLRRAVADAERELASIPAAPDPAAAKFALLRGIARDTGARLASWRDAGKRLPGESRLRVLEAWLDGRRNELGVSDIEIVRSPEAWALLPDFLDGLGRALDAAQLERFEAALAGARETWETLLAARGGKDPLEAIRDAMKLAEEFDASMARILTPAQLEAWDSDGTSWIPLGRRGTHPAELRRIDVRGQVTDQTLTDAATTWAGQLRLPPERAERLRPFVAEFLRRTAALEWRNFRSMPDGFYPDHARRALEEQIAVRDMMLAEPGWTDGERQAIRAWGMMCIPYRYEE
ncbi:MAG: hypothetical protein HYY18_02360 [Planctomycetes bacterium]|nr:hypothetical protein [Planctomycetota bacterium]